MLKNVWDAVRILKEYRHSIIQMHTGRSAREASAARALAGELELFRVWISSSSGGKNIVT